MNISLLIPLLITSIVVIIGWFTVNWLSSNRDRANKRRDLRVQYLIEAWRRLENATGRSDDSRSADLETAIADIQLFGSPRQIELAQKFANELASRRESNLDELLADLRQNLREELKLETASQNIKHLRITSNSEPKRKKR